MSEPRKVLCGQCHEQHVCEHVTVRVYRRRSQVEFRYTLCKDCMTMLATILRENASTVQRGMFAPPSGPMVP